MTTAEKRKRLRQARAYLIDIVKIHFPEKGMHWDIKNNRLYSDDSSMFLLLDTEKNAVSLFYYPSRVTQEMKRILE